MSVAASLLVRVGADTTEAESGLADFRGKMAGAADGLKSVGTKLSLGVTAPLAGMAAASGAAATSLNADMANVATLLTDLGDEAPARLDALKGAVQDLSVETGKSTSDLAGGLYQTISAFGDTSDTVKILEINAKAAAAGLATTEEAINLTSAVTKGYGDTSAGAVQNVADLAFQTVKLGQTTFPELASSMGSVVPLASSLGLAQEELFAVMATGTGVTGSASEVSTQLRGVLQSLMAPTGAMTELYTSLGYESGQAMLEQLGLQGTIQAVVGAAEASGAPLQSYMGSIEGQTLALALAGPQADVYAEKLAAMGEASGAAATAFAAQTGGVNALGFQWQQAKAQMTVLAQQLGDALVPALMSAMTAAQPLIAHVAQLATQFSTLSPRTQTLILGAVAAAAALGPMAVALGTVMSAVSALAPIVGVLGTAVGALLSPIGLVVAAVGGLLAVIFNWGGANAFVAQTLRGWGLEGVATAVEGLNEKAMGLVNTLKGLVTGDIQLPQWEAPTWLQTLFDWVWPVLGPVGWVTKLVNWAWPADPESSWFEGLISWQWPDTPAIGWLQTLFDWAWPVLGPVGWIVKLLDWGWPDSPEAGWFENLFNWEWPGLPDAGWFDDLFGWDWPELSQPSWLSKLLNFDWPGFPKLPGWMGGGGEADQNAVGGAFTSGLSWVGERGPELVQLPQGSRVYNHEDSMAVAAGAGGGGNVTINVYPQVSGQQDYSRMAREIGREFQKWRR